MENQKKIIAIYDRKVTKIGNSTYLLIPETTANNSIDVEKPIKVTLEQ